MWKRTVMILLSYLILFGMWFVIEPVTVNACSCAELPSIEEQLERKTAIFTGKILSVTKPVQGKIWSSADPVKVLFEVKTVWKGELGSQTTVHTALSSKSCGYEGFEVNKEYVVFAYGDPDRLETGRCEGNKTLASAQEELKALGAGYEPSKIIPQEIPLEVSSINMEADNGYITIVFVSVIILTTFILLIIFLRVRRR
ncbi:hypothetical protein PAT3040_03057 [Paenibacillus agaridevorans]|uniref:Tissue inhibitor of metalloproteinase n=1 Tax=Paenibacillus agaridevorans TaxID=171404 RepID=A0A2R5EYP8_9BACL|nr:hypothetical protein [Paenibacillus agaridevorans]GBG08474.1 hypothetical protein PAT3040_03057 [Paenibacillus agaridevorans]